MFKLIISETVLSLRNIVQLGERGKEFVKFVILFLSIKERMLVAVQSSPLPSPPHCGQPVGSNQSMSRQSILCPRVLTSSHLHFLAPSPLCPHPLPSHALALLSSCPLTLTPSPFHVYTFLPSSPRPLALSPLPPYPLAPLPSHSLALTPFALSCSCLLALIPSPSHPCSCPFVLSFSCPLLLSLAPTPSPPHVLAFLPSSFCPLTVSLLAPSPSRPRPRPLAL